MQARGPSTDRPQAQRQRQAQQQQVAGAEPEEEQPQKPPSSRIFPGLVGKLLLGVGPRISGC